ADGGFARGPRRAQAGGGGGGGSVHPLPRPPRGGPPPPFAPTPAGGGGPTGGGGGFGPPLACVRGGSGPGAGGARVEAPGGGVSGAAVAVGPVIGGVITSGIGWEWIFFVNVPIGVLAVIFTLTQVSESRDPDARGVDWLGLVTFSGALFLLIFALVQGNEKGW